MPRTPRSPRMTSTEFDSALRPLLTASRAATELDVAALTEDQAESALIIARNLTVITGQLADRLSAGLVPVLARADGIEHPRPAPENVDYRDQRSPD